MVQIARADRAGRNGEDKGCDQHLHETSVAPKGARRFNVRGRHRLRALQAEMQLGRLAAMKDLAPLLGYD